jgi:hypothetical protein
MTGGGRGLCDLESHKARSTKGWPETRSEGKRILVCIKLYFVWFPVELISFSSMLKRLQELGILVFSAIL